MTRVSSKVQPMLRQIFGSTSLARQKHSFPQKDFGMRNNPVTILSCKILILIVTIWQFRSMEPLEQSLKYYKRQKTSSMSETIFTLNQFDLIQINTRLIM